MTGKLILEAEGGWRRTALVWGLSFAVTAGLVVALSPHLPWKGLPRGAVIALVTYVLMRCGYRIFSTLVPRREAVRTVGWTVTEETLTLGERTIPRSAIRNVHCWPNRDSLGYTRPGWTVNIETDGKNEVLRSLTEGTVAETSARLLRELVSALGYGRNWPEA